jgi:drug/metabolite transporter (DMT)-like permease
VRRAAALSGIVAISFSAIFVGLSGVSPSTSAFFRTAYALPVLAVAALVAGRRHPRPIGARLLAAAAGISLGIDLSLWHRSIEWIGAGLATLLANTHVVFVGLGAWLLYRERPSRTTLAMAPIVFAGVALVSGLGREETFGARPIAGTLAGIGAGASYAGFQLGLRHAMRGRPGPPTGPMFDATVGAALTTLVLAPADPGFSWAFSWPGHGWLLALALGSQVAGWLLISSALPRLPGLETATLLLVQPALTVVWAQLLFDEPLATLQWVGLAVVLGGIAAITLGGSVAARRRLPPP